MMKRLVSICAAIVALVGLVGANSATAATSAQNQSNVVAVQVDGVVYSRAQFTLRFGNQDLHWVVDEAARGQGMLIAFTTHEKRNAALGLATGSSTVAGAVLADNSYQVCRNTGGGGGCNTYSASVANLGSWNDTISYVATRDMAIVLFEHANYTGCSLLVQAHKAINLTGHDFCGLFTGSWNDKASSIDRVGD